MVPVDSELHLGRREKILLKCGKNKLLNVDELPLMDPRVAEAAAACLDYASGGWVRNAKVHMRLDLKDDNSALICQQVVFQLRTQQQSALVGGLPGGGHARRRWCYTGIQIRSLNET